MAHHWEHWKRLRLSAQREDPFQGGQRSACHTGALGHAPTKQSGSLGHSFPTASPPTDNAYKHHLKKDNLSQLREGCHVKLLGLRVQKFVLEIKGFAGNISKYKYIIKYVLLTSILDHTNNETIYNCTISINHILIVIMIFSWLFILFSFDIQVILHWYSLKWIYFLPSILLPNVSAQHCNHAHALSPHWGENKHWWSENTSKHVYWSLSIFSNVAFCSNESVVGFLSHSHLRK